MPILHFPYPSRTVSSLAYTLPFHYLSFRVRSVLILALPCHLQSILVNSSSRPDRSYPYLFQTYPYFCNTHPVLSNAVQDPTSRYESVSATVLPCHYHTSSINTFLFQISSYRLPSDHFLSFSIRRTPDPLRYDSDLLRIVSNTFSAAPLLSFSALDITHLIFSISHPASSLRIRTISIPHSSFPFHYISSRTTQYSFLPFHFTVHQDRSFPFLI